MNTTTTVSGVELVADAGTRKHHDPDGKPYWTRLITCHGGGKSVTLILHANRKEALDLLPRKSIEADLAEMNTDTLDALANAIRAERQSRHTVEVSPGVLTDGHSISGTGPDIAAALGLEETQAPDDAVPTGVTVAEHLAGKYAEIDRHPRDCPGGPVTVTEDDGVPF